MTQAQIAVLRELGDDLESIAQTVSTRDGDATARQYARAESVRAALDGIKQRDKLRAALVGLVGVDGREDLEAMDAMMRLLPAPAADKAVTIDAIHALIATLPEIAP